MPAKHSINPKDFEAFLFDMDGVVTRTATIHARAWKRLFDEFLAELAQETGAPFVPFEMEDYRQFVDGMPRRDGVRSFLRSRGIEVPEGSPDDPPSGRTISALAARKDGYFEDEVEKHGVEVFPSTVDFIKQARASGLRTAIVSSSRHCGELIEVAGLTSLFDTRVDGVDADRFRIPGKPRPDMFLEAARRLGASEARCAVFEDAVSGVQAGRAGGFKLVVGVLREGPPGSLLAEGAHIEVSDLAELTLQPV